MLIEGGYFAHGKHEGESIDQVAEEDPGYLLWVLNEVELEYPDDEDILAALEEHAPAHHRKAIRLLGA